MDALWIMLKNVLIFVLLAIPGYLLVKTKLVDEKQSGVLSKILTYVGMPFLILSSTLNVTFNSSTITSILIIAVLGIVFIIGTFFLSGLLTAKDKEEKRRGIARFCMVFANNGFLGIPLAKAVFNDATILTLLIVLNILSNVIMFTLGVFLISGNKKDINLKKALLNPVLIAFIIGLILNLTKVSDKVKEIGEYSNYFSNVVTPLSMTVLGMKMAGVKMSKLFSGWRMYYISFNKLILLPILGLAVVFLTSLFLPISYETYMAFFVAFAVPTAGLASAFTDQYNGDTENAVVYTLGTTLISIITLPLLFWLLNIVLL